jgi:hypothetical protein
MDTNTIREAVLRRPFKPFNLSMNDGREFYIPHPEYVAVSRRVVFVIDHVSEAGVYLEPILISSLQYEDGEVNSKAQGEAS